MNFAMAEREFANTDHDPLALVDFPTQLKLDFLGLDMSPTHVDHLLLPGSTTHNMNDNHNNCNMSSYVSSSPHSTSSNNSNNNMRSTNTTMSRVSAVSEADQRAKNRLIVKRCYYKKIVRACFSPCLFVDLLACMCACMEVFAHKHMRLLVHE